MFAVLPVHVSFMSADIAQSRDEAIRLLVRRASGAQKRSDDGAKGRLISSAGQSRLVLRSFNLASSYCYVLILE